MTATITVSETIISINESKIENVTNVYPNPFTSYLTIALNKELINDNPSIEFILYDLVLSLVGAASWLVVGLMWKDRALIILNGVITFMLLSGLIKVLVS